MKWSMMAVMAALGLAAVGFAGVGCTSRTRDAAYGNENNWVPLGSREVAFAAERDTILVTATKGRYRSLRLHVSGSPLEMGRLLVTFGDGQRFSPKVRHAFRQGAWTRRIDLPGRQRVIRRVDFWYRSLGPKSGKATVQLYGGR